MPAVPSGGAEKWYALCERLCAAGSFTYEHPLSPPLQLSVRLRSHSSSSSSQQQHAVDVNMSDTPLSTPVAGVKRSRDDVGGEDYDGFGAEYGLRSDKKARPTSEDDASWAQDSVLNTPTAAMASNYTYQKRKYDSDDQSSMMSEPGSPQDTAMSTDDEDMLDDNDDTITFSQSPEDALPSSAARIQSSSPWQSRLQQQNRVPTPIMPPRLRPGVRPVQTHMRQRHPQEISSSSAGGSNSNEHLEVPSPIDEDEVPTPPSAAEAAGSQLSMLSVNDMDVETTAPPQQGRLPSISIDDNPIPMETRTPASTPEIPIMVPKQRQRSGALSSAQSPVRMPLANNDDSAARRRGLSMGWRADCDKCRMRVPGHMNHFVS